MLDAAARDGLSALLGPAVRFDEPMARHTSFRIGGPADALAEPRTEKQLTELVQWTQTQNIPYQVIGSGTNLLVRDGGIRGVVIRLNRLTTALDWTQKGRQVRVIAGLAVLTKRLCALSLRHGWQGFNFALGIPGTLGGAMQMNAGTALGCISDVVSALTVLTFRGEKLRLPRETLSFAYRRLRLPDQVVDAAERPAILLQGEFRLKHGDASMIRTQARQIMQARVRRQPVWQPSVGCFFKNPSPRQPAGQLIDAAGLKGASVGDAQVSLRHANFLINRGQATAADVLALKDRIQAAVWERFEIRLEPEVQIVGEENSA